MKEEIRKLAVFSKEKYRDHLEYWQRVISHDLKPMNLPLDFNRHHKQERAIDSIKIKLPAELAGKLAAPDKQSDMALFVVLLAAFKVFLCRCTGNEEILIAAPLLKLDNKPLEHYHYNRRILLRDRPHTGLTFKEFLLDTKNKTLEAYKNQNYPLDMAFKKSGHRIENYFFLDRITFLLKNLHEKNDIVDLNYDLLFSFLREGQVISGEIFFNKYLFKKETVEQFGWRYIKILAYGLNNLDTVIKDFNILSAKEMAQLLYEFNRTQWEYPGQKTIEQLFQEQAARAPHRAAVVGNNGTGWITYKELNERSNQLARLLRKKSAEPDNIVALMMEPSVDMIIAILGILKAGKAYLPIDAAFPEKRIHSILEDSSAPILLTKEKLIRHHSFRSLQGADFSETPLTVTPSRPPVDQLDTLQIPDRSYIDYKKYSPYIGQSMIKDSITFQFSRGCRYNCAYCFKIWSGNRYVHRSAENMFEELLLYYKLGVRKFSFVDDLPNFNIKESAKFYRLIIKNHLNLRLFYPNGLRGDILTKDYIDLMVEAGTISLDVALETTSPRLQKLIRKNLDLEKLDKNIRYMIDKYPRLILETQLLHGIPTETEEEAQDSLDYLKSLEWVHMPYLHVLKVYPGTAMARLAMKHGISPEAIERSDSLGYNELPETLPFPKSFTHKYQSEFASEYFMSKERLLAVLPYQMKALTRDELVQKYNSFLPVTINCFSDLLDYVGIRPEELDAEFLPDNYGRVPGINTKIRDRFPRENPRPDALKILLIDVSAYFTHDRHGVIYDVVEPSLGLMYVQTHLDRTFASQVNGKIVSSRIDFDDFPGLRTIINDFKPDVIGIRTLNFYKDFFHKTVSFIRQWGIHVPIIAGGPYATSSYQTLLKDTNIDLVVLGEGEITFAEIIGKIIENNGILPADEVLKKIPGIAFVEGKEKLQQKKCRREILMWDQLAQTLSGESLQNPEPVNKPGDIAYVIYTSGSTGTPKGVMVQHNNLVNQITGLVKTFNFDHTHHYILLAAFTFDVSVMHIFLPLSTGAKLFLIADHIKKDPLRLWQFIDDKQVDILNIVPAFMKALLENIERKKIHFNLLFVGGEVFDMELYHRLKETFAVERIINIYGPTETTINALLYQCHGDESKLAKTIPIGKPLLNYKAYILDRNLNLVPIGIAGELCIGGQGTARGYLNRPELTFENFLPVSNRFYRSNRSYRTYISKKIYKTGDLARWLPDGDIEFLGRIDRQVKIRGFRIEPEEIERRLLTHPAVKETIVLAKGDQEGEKYLCAYIVPGDANKHTVSLEVSEANLKKHLMEKLPDYMAPTYFVVLKKMPLTPTGKIDVKMLPLPASKIDDLYIAPRDEIEEKLTGLWAQVVGMDKTSIGIDANFFSLGGHSLKATILISKIHKELDIRIPLVELFQKPTIRGLSEYIQGAVKDKHAPIKAVEDKEYYEVSSAQKRLYIFQTMDPESSVYNNPIVVVLEGVVEREKLEKAFKKLQERHESLRTSFQMKGLQVVQKIHKAVDAAFTMAYYEMDEAAARELVQDFEIPFDLSDVPLFRIGLIKLEQTQHILMFDMHHIITDGTSTEVMIRDFLAFTAGLGEELPLVKIRYRDFSQWQNTQLKSSEIKNQKDFWLKTLGGEIPLLQLPEDYPRPLMQTNEVGILPFGLGNEIKNALIAMAQAEGATLFVLLATACMILLSKVSGQEDIVIGTHIAGRRHADIQSIIGMFINTLVLRNYPIGEKSLIAFLKEVKQRIWDAFENQDYPFEDLLDQLPVPRNPGRNPLFDVVFALKNYETDPGDIPEIKTHGLKSKPYRYKKKKTTFDLFWLAEETRDNLYVSLRYSAKLFKEETIQRLIRYFRRVISTLLEEPGIKISEIEIITTEEKKQLIFDFNNNRADFPNQQTPCDSIEKYARLTPHRIAAISQESQLTFGVLDRRVNPLVGHLLGKGVDEDSLVGILLDRSLLMVESILAVWKAGGAYIPLDPQYPNARIIKILNDSSTRLIITHSRYVEPELENVYQGIVIKMDKEKLTGDCRLNHPGPWPKTNMHRLAYVIYTSGSTGNPKGVMVEHRGMMNHIQAKINDLHLADSSIIAQNASHTFDISVWQFFAALVLGGKTIIYTDELILDPEQFISRVIKDGITILEVVPSYLSIILDLVAQGHRVGLPLHYLLVTGEEIKPHLVKKWFDLYPGIKMVNAYGPTEASDDITHHMMDKAPGPGSVPIGKTLQNLNIYIVDKNMQLCPIGVKGEICVSGVGVGRGYLNNPQLTGRTFISSQDSTGKIYSHMSHRSYSSNIYKTGDIGRWLPNGTIEFFGRKDYQVKIRGFRIELGEIEHHLVQYAEVKEAVVIDRHNEIEGSEPGGSHYLCAYLVPASHKPLNITDIKKYLSKCLPGHILPAYFVELEHLPLTSTGKIDRKSLPEPGVMPSGMKYITGEMLKTCVSPWKKQISKEPVGDVMEKVVEKGVISEEDKERILHSFNNTRADYPGRKLLHGLFEDQVNKNKVTDRIAAAFSGNQFTYGELNGKANQLAVFLRSQGVTPDNPVALLVDRSLEMLIGIYAVLKAGGAYLPIDPWYPGERINYMLADSGAKIILTGSNKSLEDFPNISAVVNLEAVVNDGNEENDANLAAINRSTSLAVIFYTSGTTGYPKGVLVEHHSLVNRLNWMQKFYPLEAEDTILQKTPITFDVSVWELFWWGMRGASLYLLAPGQEGNPPLIVEALQQGNVTTMHYVPSMFTRFLEYLEGIPNLDGLSCLKQVFVSGEALGIHHVEQFNRLLNKPNQTRLVNLYGPTEAAVDVSYFNCPTGDRFDKIPIGKPIDNIALYIVDKGVGLQPIGIPGELCISGVGLARGYLNEPGLTELRFVNNPFQEGERLYQTGDLAQWLPDGNIEFLGRMDHQIKINGIRVEVGEIESFLLKRGEIKEAAVIARENKKGKLLLYAFLVSDKRLIEAEIREYLAAQLPFYMVPTDFVQLEKIPVTANGKIDRKLLELVDLKTIPGGTDDTGSVTGDEILEKLREIWAEVLVIERTTIDMDGNFFEMGGHSLTATILISKIHKELNTRVPFMELFKKPTVRGLWEYIRESEKNRYGLYTSIEPAKKKEYYPLSSAQKRLYISQQMEPTSTIYNMPQVLILEGMLDQDRIKKAFRQLIQRHEPLRSSFMMKNGEPVQKIHRQAEFEIEYYDASQVEVEEERSSDLEGTIISSFVRPFDLSRVPLMRVGLIKTGEKKHLLMVDLHHIFIDIVSSGILVKDFMALYDGKKLTPLRIQYKDFALWQKKWLESRRIKKQEQYWLNKFKNYVPVLNIRTDHPRSPGQNIEGDRVTFEISPTLTRQLRDVVLARQVTMNILLMTVFNILLYKYTSQEDIVVGIPRIGRNHADLHHILGIFINMLAIRNFPRSQDTFGDFLAGVKENMVGAYDNEDYQLEELVHRLKVERVPGRNPLFDVVFSFHKIEEEKHEAANVFDHPDQKKLRVSPYNFEFKQSKFDLQLRASEGINHLHLMLEYKTSLFKRSTAEEMRKHYVEILEQVVENQGIPLKDIKISHDLLTVDTAILEEEKIEFGF